jgi:Fic family protein
MKLALGDWEQFLHDDRPMPLLLKTGIMHAQFETIHPFLDGNGRVGRLLITFFLCERQALKRPLLYLSHFFKLNRLEYYDRLQAVRDKGDWEGWLRFFLLREEQRARIQASFGRTTADGLRLHEQLFEHPYVTVNLIQQLAGKGFVAANRLASQMVEAQILREVTGQARRRVYLHERYFQMFDDSQIEASQVTSFGRRDETSS